MDTVGLKSYEKGNRRGRIGDRWGRRCVSGVCEEEVEWRNGGRRRREKACQRFEENSTE
jgi:hypothetical protein